MNFQQVHLRINDAATGQPTPVRLRITDAEGTYYAPFGRLTEFATGVNQDVGGNVQIGAKKWAYIDGACEILLPPGPLHIEVTKGPEYTPIDEDVTLLAGKMSMRFTIQRWSDVRKEGWYSGDTRVHFMSPDAALLEGQAEDVAVVNLLAKETTVTDSSGNTYKDPNILAFSGQSSLCEAEGCGVAVNTQNTHPKLGSLGLLHCHRVVYPLSFTDEDWTCDDWCGQCHRKKGLVVWTDSRGGDRQSVPEPLADLILGNVDAFETSFFDDSPSNEITYYLYALQVGYGVSLVGASAKDSNAITLGNMRTYALLPKDQEFTYSRWIEAVRAGRTFVTSGPLFHFTIDGVVPGRTLVVPRDKKSVHVRIEARSWQEFDTLELDGVWPRPSAAPTRTSPYEAVLEWDVPVEASGWLAARCRGETLLPNKQRLFAHSTAVSIQKEGAEPWANLCEVEQMLRIEIQALLDDAADVARPGSPGRRERLCREVEKAYHVLAKKLSSPSGN